MERRTIIWTLIGLAFTALGGSLLHFLYGWTKRAVWAAPLSAVNESTWEHMKLFFLPTLLFAAIQSFFVKRADFWCVKLSAMLIGLALIPLLFYLYNGAIAKSPDWLNIAFFFVSAAAAYWYEITRFTQGDVICKSPWLALGILLGLAMLFALFTFYPPRLLIFRDPITGTYGV